MGDRTWIFYDCPKCGKKETSNKKLEEILQEGIEKVKDEEVKKLLKESLNA